MNAAAQFAHSMATLLAAGLPLPRALEVTANVVSNYTFSLAVVRSGRTWSAAVPWLRAWPASSASPPCSLRW